jgi:hypothetical protein
LEKGPGALALVASTILENDDKTSFSVKNEMLESTGQKFLIKTAKIPVPFGDDIPNIWLFLPDFDLFWRINSLSFQYPVEFPLPPFRLQIGLLEAQFYFGQKKLLPL